MAPTADPPYIADRRERALKKRSPYGKEAARIAS
jgi:hypothetical protein